MRNTSELNWSPQKIWPLNGAKLPSVSQTKSPGERPTLSYGSQTAGRREFGPAVIRGTEERDRGRSERRGEMTGAGVVGHDDGGRIAGRCGRGRSDDRHRSGGPSIVGELDLDRLADPELILIGDLDLGRDDLRGGALREDRCPSGDLLAALSQRFEDRYEAFFQFLGDAETFENGKAEGDERHDGEQRRINEAHRAQRQLAREDVAQNGIQVLQDTPHDAAASR